MQLFHLYRSESGDFRDRIWSVLIHVNFFYYRARVLPFPLKPRPHYMYIEHYQTFLEDTQTNAAADFCWSKFVDPSRLARHCQTLVAFVSDHQPFTLLGGGHFVQITRPYQNSWCESIFQLGDHLNHDPTAFEKKNKHGNTTPKNASWCSVMFGAAGNWSPLQNTTHHLSWNRTKRESVPIGSTNVRWSSVVWTAV